MKAPLPERVAGAADILVALATLALAGTMLWDNDPGSRSLIAMFTAWALAWLLAYFAAPRYSGLAWALRLVLSAVYFVDAAWDWRKANGETHAYMIMAGIPLAALLLFYLVLFASATYVHRQQQRQTA